jgi:hypothetical protein
MHTFVPCPQFFCLLKPIAHVCTPKMAEDELSAYSVSSMACHQASLFGVQGRVAGPGMWDLRSLGLGSKIPVSRLLLEPGLPAVAWLIRQHGSSPC